ncbi:hypothetical protein GGX14DRAFT_398529 [Mycena pura]|uniref:Secreted protein n=1 Tax=Mycena pura TaxID=153505 RepID=A0AAD6YDD1_9AGAR|nr:hypothetical protein GGX14DRAFT_398519 [Mycena pura]KAJ7203771.1 hypothetical protein GGX14DRAFT_398529 [Mycena pura]
MFCLLLLSCFVPPPLCRPSICLLPQISDCALATNPSTCSPYLPIYALAAPAVRLVLVVVPNDDDGTFDYRVFFWVIIKVFAREETGEYVLPRFHLVPYIAPLRCGTLAFKCGTVRHFAALVPAVSRTGGTQGW